MSTPERNPDLQTALDFVMLKTELEGISGFERSGNPETNLRISEEVAIRRFRDFRRGPSVEFTDRTKSHASRPETPEWEKNNVTVAEAATRAYWYVKSKDKQRMNYVLHGDPNLLIR